MITRRATLGLLAATPFLLSLRPAYAAEPAIYAEGGIALGGTDVVAYVTEAAPVAGDPAITHDWMGATWRFASAANRDAFAAEPDRYAPAYGGYCAWAVAQGYLAPTVPEAWTIHEGRLYLNASARIQRRWERDIPGFIAGADAQWPAILG